MTKATTGSRFLAILIDSLIISVLAGLLSYFSIFIFNGYIFFYSITFYSWIISILYSAIFEGDSGSTLGKKALNIKVVDQDGYDITFKKSFLRAFCKYTLSEILLIGYIMAFIDENGLALHDRIAGTWVIKTTPDLALSPPVQPNSEFKPSQNSQTNSSGRHPVVVGIKGQFAGKSYAISLGGSIFGRDAASCDFVFPENAKGISRTHCKLEYNPNTCLFILHDLGSTYGTFRDNGERIERSQPVALQAGEKFYLSNRSNLFMVTFG